MTADETPDKPGHDEVRALAIEGALSRSARILARDYPDSAAHAEDGVYEAVAMFLAKRDKGEDVEEPIKWIFVVAKRNILKRLERQVNRESHGASALESALAARINVVRDEQQVLEDDTFRYVVDLVDAWESRRMGVVTRLYLESEYHDEPLSQEEAAEQASILLDEDVPWTSIGKTRARGLVRLHAQILEIATATGINPVYGRETS